VVLEAGESAVPAAAFQADRAEVLPLQLNVAQTAEKATEGVARNDRSFLRVVKATSLTYPSGSSLRRRVKQGGK